MHGATCKEGSMTYDVDWLLDSEVELDNRTLKIEQVSDDYGDEAIGVTIARASRNIDLFGAALSLRKQPYRPI